MDVLLARRLGLLSALYFVQGLPYGFQLVGVPVILTRREMPIEQVTLLGVVLGMPWILKALWAPIVDAFASESFGRRRSWIVPMQLGLAGACLLMASLGEMADTTALIATVLLMNVFSATMDVAVDGYAIDVLEEAHLGYGNIAQVVGAKVGILVGGGVLLSQQEALGWARMFMVMGGAVFFVALMVIASGRLVKWERTEHAASRGPWEEFRSVLATLRRTLSSRSALLLLLFVFTYKTGESISDALFKPFLAGQLDYTSAEVGRIVGTWGMMFSLTGSFVGGVLASKLPLLRAVAICAILRVFPIAAEWWLVAGRPATELEVTVVTCAEHFFGGSLTTAMFAYMMSRVDERFGATHFTLLATVEVLGKLIAGASAGLVAKAVGFAPSFAMATGLSALFLLLLLPLAREAKASVAAANA